MSKKANERERVENARRNAITEFCRSQLGIEVEHNFNLAAMSLVTSKLDGTKMTKEQHDRIMAFCLGWEKARAK